MGRACSNGLDRAGCSSCCGIAGNSSGARTWTSDDALGAWRGRGFVANSRRHCCIWFYAGCSDGADLGVTDDRRFTDDEETGPEHAGEVFLDPVELTEAIEAPIL